MIDAPSGHPHREADPSQLAGDKQYNNIEFIESLLKGEASVGKLPSMDEFLGILASQRGTDVVSDSEKAQGGMDGRTLIAGVEAFYAKAPGFQNGEGLTRKGGIRQFLVEHGKGEHGPLPIVDNESGLVTLHNREQLAGYLKGREVLGIPSKHEADVTHETPEVIASIDAFIELVNSDPQNLERYIGGRWLASHGVPGGIRESVGHIIKEELVALGHVEPFAAQEIDDDVTIPRAELDAIRAEADDDVTEDDPDALERLRDFAAQVRADAERDAKTKEEVPEPVQNLSGAEVIEEQIAQLNRGEGVVHVVEVPRDDAESSSPEVQQPEYITEEELVEGYFQQMIEGDMDIPDADPDMLSEYQRRINTIRRNYAEARAEAEMTGIGEEMMASLRELMRNGDTLSQIEAAVSNTGQIIQSAAQALRGMGSHLEYGGGIDGLAQVVGPVAQARRALDESPARRVFSGEVFEPSVETFRRMMTAAGDSEERIQRAKRAGYDYEESEVNNHLGEFVRDGARNLDGLQTAVDDEFPDRKKVHANILEVEAIAHSILTVGILVDQKMGGYHNHAGPSAFKRFEQEFDGLISQMRNNRYDGAEAYNLAFQAEKLGELLNEIQTFTRRTRNLAEAELGN